MLSFLLGVALRWASVEVLLLVGLELFGGCLGVEEQLIRLLRMIHA